MFFGKYLEPSHLSGPITIPYECSTPP
ncbi:Bgt-20790 [Blumeria graminis f. sp. tritici]|uniref:Bgt-20790 n=1 Tax=Blumeria graminis f. sp. tritici TaxID=62690 RepID=A0A9X9PQ93_BLUGR|nr:Bgt-20790 [Blumeria graminis f. sp. tritici]